ncbi:MAG: VWA domain-containing protein [Actinomycetota bacterium]|nr:VWA domain-containing protein [Actinomycetota bacterium]
MSEEIRHFTGVRRFTYSKWDGTQQIAELDANALMEALGDELIENGDPNSALRRLMQRGLNFEGGRLEGLREILQKLRQKRQETIDQNSLGGIYDEINEALEQVISTERESLEAIENRFRDDERNQEINDEALKARSDELDMLEHENLASRVKGLSDYDFTSTVAAQKFEELLESLREQLMQQAIDQMAGEMKNMTSEDMSRMKDMLAALNEMLSQRQEGETPDFEKFMEEYGDFFPENPRSLEELLEVMAQRMANMSQILNSMSPEQRAQLEELSEQLLEDMDLRWQMDQLSENLREAFPEMGWEHSVEFQGDNSLNLPEAIQTFEDLADLDRLEQMLRNVSNPGALSEVDTDRARELLGDESAESLEQLAEMSRMLEEAGLVENKDGQLSLTPKAIRKLGQNALADLYRRISKDRAGRHNAETIGAGHERDYATKSYEFGDPFNLNIERTVRNGLVRNGSGTPVVLEPEDFEIERTEATVQASTVLMLDLSLSMPMRDNFLPAKKVAMALNSLISGQFPRDFLGVVTFSEIAREIRPEKLPEVSWDYVYGTNMQHGLMLARRMLAKQSGTKQIIMVTDGEPTAHITEEGFPFFNYPPSSETIEKTLMEVKRCTRDDIRINVFMLDATPYLTRFIEHVTKMNGGRAFFTTNQSLGDYLLVDFVEQRRSFASSR